MSVEFLNNKLVKMNTIIKFVKNETVLVIAWILAIVSMFIIPPDGKYASYIDMYTLILLFCLMLVMAGFREQGVFVNASNKLLLGVHTSKQLEAVLIFLPFFSSMFITNDVALITFVPFAIEILRVACLEKRVIFVVTMQTIAANLGSILLPIGNPQNIYLYSFGNYSLGSFVQVMLPYAIVSLVVISVIIAIRHTSNKISVENSGYIKGDIRKIVVYSIIFILALCAVAKLISAYLLLAVTVAAVLVFDRKIIKKADYSLLLTFVGFFIFVGNTGRISQISELIKSVFEGNEVIISAITSQVISNVPAALLLSGFTQNTDALLTGVNIGGLGTLIASMASLISYKYVCAECPNLKKKYFIYFTKMNIIFLIILIVLYFILK